MRSVSFDYATVDEKGTRLPTEKAAAYLFTEALTSDVGLDMVAIPGGTFLMGSPIYEPERRPNEGPQHQVTVKPFFVGASPITQAQWAAVVTARPDKTRYALQPFPSFFKGDGLPVESVTWNEADEFCRRLSEIAGRGYRLPSEAEWEYACRAGTTGPFNVGPTITTELANYCGAGGAVCGDNNGRSIASDVYDGVTYGSGAMTWARRASSAEQQRPRGRSPGTASASTTCTATCGNIASTGQASVMPTFRRTAARTFRERAMASGCCGAVRGRTTRQSAVPPIEISSPPTTPGGRAALVSGWFACSDRAARVTAGISGQGMRPLE